MSQKNQESAVAAKSSSREEEIKSEPKSASRGFRDAQATHVKSSIKALFSSFADEQFEDGMDNEFVDELTMLINTYGTKTVNCLANVVATKSVKPEIISEALRRLGQIEHPESYGARLSLLDDSLRNPSRWIRDGAALGLAAMKDSHAAPFLREAIRKENVPDLKRDLELVLDRLEH